MRSRTPCRPGPGARSELHAWGSAWLGAALLAAAVGLDPTQAAVAAEPGVMPQAETALPDAKSQPTASMDTPQGDTSATPAGTNSPASPVRPQHPPAPAHTAAARPADTGSLVVPRPSTAAWDIEQAAQCTTAIHDAEGRHELPSGLLGAIAKTESGRPISSLGDVRAWPWTIDADGQGLFFESKAAAVAWAKQGLARGVRLMDIGCMQVNLQMHPEAFHSIEDAFDPAANADYAARYLRQLQGEAGGNWNVAVGLYHSHTPDLAAAYRERVAQVGAGIVTGIGGPEPLYMRAIRQGTLHLALAGGGMLVINLNRQPHATRRRGQSPCQVASMLRPLLASAPRVKGCKA